jgi:ubiquinone/menaquinone biosynthesis C-methylase UbiE
MSDSSLRTLRGRSDESAFSFEISAMLPRVLEPEVMDSPAEAEDYDAMDHAQVNRAFVTDFLTFCPTPTSVLDIGTGTAQIPIELCRQNPTVRVLGIDLAEHMLAVGRRNVHMVGLDERIELGRVDAKGLPFADGAFGAVISNSIIHHIPEPRLVVQEMARATAAGGAVFVRDLLRPETDAGVRKLVDMYAAGANAHQRQMFDDSLRAALTLDEIRALVQSVGFEPNGVQQTTDRHWTWSALKP